MHAVAFPDALVHRTAGVSAVADHPVRSFGEEALIERGSNEFCFMTPSAGHVQGERKNMAVSDRHDFAGLPRFAGPISELPFFVPLKLPRRLVMSFNCLGR